MLTEAILIRNIFIFWGLQSAIYYFWNNFWHMHLYFHSNSDFLFPFLNIGVTDARLKLTGKVLEASFWLAIFAPIGYKTFVQAFRAITDDVSMRALILYRFYFSQHFMTDKVGQQRKKRSTNSYLFCFYKLYRTCFWSQFLLELKSFLQKFVLRFRKSSYSAFLGSKRWEDLSEWQTSKVILGSV